MTVNAGSGELISIKNLAEKIIALLDRALAIEWDPQGPTAKTKILLSNSKAQKLLGWSRKITLNQGLQKTIDWFKQNKLERKR